MRHLELESLSAGEFKRLCGVSRGTFGEMVEELRPHLERHGKQGGQNKLSVEDQLLVASAFGISAAALTADLQTRIDFCVEKTRLLSAPERPTVACIEWIEPLMAAGNWIPELVNLAGGQSLFGTVGQHSPWLKWEDLIQANPEVIVIMPCGFDLDRTEQEAKTLEQHPGWATLQAVQTDRVYVTDGNQYFNRPEPRLVNSLEILAEILHPNLFSFGYEGQSWRRFGDR